MRYLPISPIMFSSALIAAFSASAENFHVNDSTSLQEALNAAANNEMPDTITLADGTYRTVENGDSFVFNDDGGNNLTLIAEHRGAAILDGNGIDEVLIIKHVRLAGTVTLDGLVLQNGSRGARIQNASTEVRHVSFHNHQIETGLAQQDGAALKVLGGVERVTIEESLFMDNKAMTGSLGNHGGAVALQANNITIRNSQFLRNQANNSGGALRLWPGAKNTLIENCNFEDNMAGPSTSAFGGAIHSSYPLVSRSNLFHRNQAQTHGIYSSQGGAIFADAAINSEGDLFRENSASIGGAIRSDAKTSIVSAVFRENSATGMGAAVSIYSVLGAGANTVHNSLFIHNRGLEKAPDSAVYCFKNCQVVNSLFDGNTGPAAIYFGSGSQGGENVVANTVFVNTGTLAVNSGIYFSQPTKVTLLHNYLDTGEIGTAAEFRYASGNFKTQDPGYSDTYKPAAESPLVDAGVSEPTLFGLPATDHAGYNRIAGSTVDIGPFEYGSAAIVVPTVPGGGNDPVNPTDPVTNPSAPPSVPGDVNFSDAVRGGGSSSWFLLLGLAATLIWQRCKPGISCPDDVRAR